MTDPLAAFQTAVADRYAIEGRLGEGGMAIVFLANDLRHNRAVAVKVLRPEFAAVLGPDRFLREINFAAELNHPHIVPLFDSGVVPGGDGYPPLPYYVMPRLPGESLRERIAREGALPIEEAVEIAREVAQALAYAHAHGIVHRDIKPANILLSDGEAVVADFGIARAVDRAGEGDQITDSGLTLGTPSYMAPEQTTGDSQLDGRADIYALGCVLYEMLGGSPPFIGATAAAVIARHRTDAPPSLRTLRETVPAGLEAIVLRALAKSPADRFRSAEEMSRALSPGSGSFAAITVTAEPPRHRRRLMIQAAMVVLAAVAVGVIARNIGTPKAGDPIALATTAAGADLDTTRYAVAPFEYEPGLTDRIGAAERILDALAEWDGVTLVDAQQMQDTSAQPSAASERSRAAAYGAGRLLRGQVGRAGTELRISAQLLATATGELIGRHSVRVSPTLGDADSALDELVERLLLPRRAGPADGGGREATASLAAHQAFAAGADAVNAWDLTAAAERFGEASRHDPEYPQALLWAALARAWSGSANSEWRSAAERAGARRSRLSPRDQVVADAILSAARDDLPAACRIWNRLVRERPDEFIGWYGSGDCQSRDDAVLPDPASASGWRFRTSYHAALRAYQRALQLQPSIHQGLSAGGFEPVSALLKLRPTSARFGSISASGQPRFLALPAWDRDTLAFVPWPLDAFRSPPTLLQAVQHQRELFHDIAKAWTVALPSSPTALEALAFSLELLGQPGALETLERAQRLATGEKDRLRIATRAVWVRLRMSAPGRPSGVSGARALADSVLAASRGRRDEPLSHASLAALTGRIGEAARAFDHPQVGEALQVPPGLFPAATRLLLYAAIGGPPDTIRALAGQVSDAIERTIPVDERQRAREAWLARAATLAFPSVRLDVSGSPGDYLLSAMNVLARGDSPGALRTLRAGVPPEEPATFAERPADAVFPEAWLLAASGDTAGAIRWLDHLIGSLYGKAPRASVDPVEAASLVRAMALRAELAARTGDSATAARWAQVVSTLWSGGDPPLRRVVERMNALRR